MTKLAACALLFFACAAPSVKPTPAPPPPAMQPAPEDPNLWLEDVSGDRALSWVKEQNKRSTGELVANPAWKPLHDRFLSILDSDQKLAYVNRQGAFVYNFWKDKTHARGLWRRTTLASYEKPSPAWETVLDLDELGAREKESWVWEGATCLYPRYDRCLVTLSRGGADATVIREFDTKKRAFVEGGFQLPEAKSQVAWIDEDELFVGTDFGPGSLTDSGYPRIVKRWKRGTKLADAPTVYEGKQTDLTVVGYRAWVHGRPLDLVSRAISFYENELYVLEHGALVGVPVPRDADAGPWGDLVLVRLRSAWSIAGRTFDKGALVAVPRDKLLGTAREQRDGATWGVPKLSPDDLTLLFEPGANRSLAGSVGLKDSIVVTELEDVKDKVYLWKKQHGKLVRAAVPAGTTAGTVDVLPLDANEESDDFFLRTVDFTTPSTLWLARAGGPPRQLKQSPSFFDGKGLVTEQHFATSKDGTRVPYFQVSKQALLLDGNNPTVLTGYGGFEVSLSPEYDALAGAGWIEKGGVYVQANIRGGGEYGPAWHEAALKGKRQHAYDDFIAIAEDLVARKVTSPRRLGIRGGSNGGLLMGVMLTQRPDLFGAVVCQAPLLDMKRYHKLLAGASWMSEYGDPDQPAEWAAIAKYSPYENVKAGVKYPRTLFTTSTRDDRVHPGHARKMAARMLSFGDDLLFYENIEGGHGGAANNEERAYLNALAYTFFAQQLKLGQP